MADAANRVSEEPSDESRGDKASWLVAHGVLLERGPRRTLATASFINMLGSGVFTLSAAVFFTRSVGLPVSQVGLGMGLGALVGLLSGVPVGGIADRRGPREIYMLTLTAQAVAMAMLVLVHTFWLFTAVVCLTELASSAGQAARGPIVRGLAGERPARFRAYLRSAVNLASSIGALPAALVVQLDTHAAYLCLVLGNALSFLATAFVVARLPSLPPVPPPAGAGRWSALEDYRYMVVTALDGIMAMHGSVLVFALPLWIVGHTHAPRWFVGTSVLVNTIMVVVLQVRASRDVDSNASAARAWRRAGWAFLACLALIGFASGLPAWGAVLLILLGVGVHTLGELLYAAGSFELRYNLAPAHAQGQYSGVFRFGSGLTSVAAPSLLAWACLKAGTPGWLLLGGLFLCVGLVVPRTVRWAERPRPVQL
ncbi:MULTISPECIES: MFS transporter [unclassified Streptomyces]|uniref:MFS transporter n=1 Tax=unclassified Streptomyces TaxID=2593676 RepID=UPI0036B855DA